MDALSSEPFLHSLVDWIRQYPAASGVFVFGAAMLESLVLVGVLVPGAALMLGAGALIALGALDLWPTLVLAAAGAVAGDGISFWIGHHYRERLRQRWPFSRFSGLLHRGEVFFSRHGGKSVVFGRFVGPVRAVIPTVAGMMGMSPLRFAAVNIASAIAWAPAYILPGMVFGASLEIASEVALRLALTALLLIAALWLSVWLIRRVYRLLAPRAGRLLARSLEWSRAHPLLGRPARALVDPGQSESSALALLALVLLASGFGASYLFWRLHAAGAPPQVDTGLHSLMRSLRTPWADQLMVAVTMLSDAAVYLPLSAAVWLWLLWRRKYSAACHWLAALGFGMLLTVALTTTPSAPQPAQFYGIATLAIPSGHTMISTLLYGFLAVLAARDTGPRRGIWVYTTASAMIVLIAFSRLYLGTHWFTEVAGGFTLGLAWLGALGVAYRRHSAAPLSAFRLLSVAGFALLLFGGLHIALHYDREVQRYALRYPLRTLSATDWWHDDWRTLPAFRDDVVDSRKQPLAVQWAGKLERIRQQLQARGWQVPVAPSARSALYWFLPDVPLQQLPVLPQVHDGRHESLVLTHPAGAQLQWVLRLWPSNVRLQPGASPVWIGTISAQFVRRHFGLISFPVTSSAFNRPRTALIQDLQGWDWREVRRQDAAAQTRVHWDGGVLLVRPPSP